MPIFNFKIAQGNWKIAKECNKKDFYKLIKIFKSAYKTFAFKDDKLLKQFRYSFKQYESYENGFFEYDFNNSKIDAFTYQLMLDSLIKEANYYLSLNKNAKYKKYKFDIIGDFTIGRVALMTKE